MKLTLLVVVLCALVHKDMSVQSQPDAVYGIVYLIKESINDEYTGYIKIGHSSANEDHNNCDNRISNIRAGNPRKLEYDRVYWCNSKNTAATAENEIRAMANVEGFEANLGGSNEWVHVPNNRMGEFLQIFRDGATNIYNCRSHY